MADKNRVFILNDETVKNTHGFYLSNKGGKLERFLENPVMLNNHNPNELLGKWIKVEIVGNKLQAVPEFDQGSDFAKEKERQVNDGYLKGASLGIIIKEAEFVDGELYVTEWEAIEASVTPIPSNSGALCFYDESRRKLSIDQVKGLVEKLAGTKTSTDMKIELFAAQLGLEANATEAQVTKAIGDLVKERDNLKADLQQKSTRVVELETEISDQKKEKIKVLLDAAIKDKKIDEGLRETYETLAKNDYDGAVKAINALPGVGRVKDNLQGRSDKVPDEEKNWTFKEYLKQGKAEQLKAKDYDRFCALYKEQYGRDYEA